MVAMWCAIRSMTVRVAIIIIMVVVRKKLVVVERRSVLQKFIEWFYGGHLNSGSKRHIPFLLLVRIAALGVLFVSDTCELTLLALLQLQIARLLLDWLGDDLRDRGCVWGWGWHGGATSQGWNAFNNRDDVRVVWCVHNHWPRGRYCWLND